MPALCHLQPEYETPRLRMRLLRPGDEDFLAFLDSDPSVMQHIHCGPLSQANARHFARLQIEMAAFRIHLGKWIALLRDHMAPIGWVELSRHKGRDRDDIELGYEIAVEHWGRGYATEASRPLITYAFGVLHADRMYRLYDQKMSPLSASSTKLGSHELDKGWMRATTGATSTNSMSRLGVGEE